MTEQDIGDDPTLTHKVVITILSNDDDNMLDVKVEFSPDSEIEELGYLPASYQLLTLYVLPAIEQAYKDWEERIIQHDNP